MEPYNVEAQRIEQMRHDKGVIELSVYVPVTVRTARDEPAPASFLHLPVEHACTLLILLKQQLAELDKPQPASRRSCRA